MNLLHNVNIVTMDQNFTRAGAMVFNNGGIVETGDFHALKGKYGRAIHMDGHGRTVLPGFIDPHNHFLIGALSNGFLDCTPEKVPDVASLQKRLQVLTAEVPKEQWIVGQGYDPVRFPGHKSPTRKDLDAACPDHPAFIIHYSLHEAIANSRALDQLKIDQHTPQPFAGEIEKDRNGIPTGRLIESISGKAMAMAMDNWINCAEDRFFQQVKAAEKQMFGFGITRLGDPAVSTNAWAFYEKLYQQGILHLPVVGYPASDGNMYDLPFAKAEAQYKEGSDKLPMVGPVKFFLDGADRAGFKMTLFQSLYSGWQTMVNVILKRSLNPIRIGLRSPVQVGRDFYFHVGEMMAKTADLNRCLKTAVQNGHPVALHAIGNEAIAQAVDAMKSLGVPYDHPAPPRIEHALFPTDHDIRMIKETGLAIATQPAFLAHMGSDNLPPIKGLKKMPLRTFIDAGIHVAGSSDWPVDSCNPLVAMERAVTRRTTEDEVLDRKEAITVPEAINMYTREGAFLLGQTQHIGSLEPGKRADFIVLDKNPFEAAPENIGAIRVEETYLGGERVYRRTA